MSGRKRRPDLGDMDETELRGHVERFAQKRGINFNPEKFRDEGSLRNFIKEKTF